MLTQAIAATGARVAAVERDPFLAHRLRVRFARLEDVTIVEADVAEYDWPAVEFAVVANLPFAGSGAIIDRLLRDPARPLRRADVIVQWEFAAKHAAVSPSTLRGSYWRAWYDVEIVRRLDRSAFAPPPSVDAAVLSFERRAAPRVPAELHESYRHFLDASFGTHEKVGRALRPSLSPLQLKRLAPVLGFSVEAHARDLDAGQLAQLFEASRAPSRR